MISLQKITLFFVSLLLPGALGAGLHQNLESFTATQVEGEPYNITVQWTVQEVSLLMNDTSFELSRSMVGNGTESRRIPNDCIVKNGNTFSCEDTDLYKGTGEETASTENVTYTLNATHNDGQTYSYGQTSVEYTTNAVRRTWGSIKAMFQ